MAKSGHSRPKVGQSAWSGIVLVASLLVVVLMVTLYRFEIIGMEGMGYFTLLTFLLATLAVLPYWQSLDEPSREAHKFAVWWGLGWAFAIVTVLGCEMLFFSGLRDVVQGWVEGWIAFSDGELGEQQGAVGFYLGILASTFMLGLGYILVWIGWWARQRIGTQAD